MLGVGRALELRIGLFAYAPQDARERILPIPSPGGYPPDLRQAWGNGKWADELLAPERLRREGWLNADAVDMMWKKTLAGEIRVDHIWSALMFQAWLEYCDGSGQKLESF